jgi:hypothetical protein
MKSLKNSHEANMGGNVRLFLADITEITSFPIVASMIFSGNIRFAAGKGFYEFDCAQQSIDAIVKPDGDFYIHNIKCVVPEVSQERDDILTNWKNTPLIVLRKIANGAYFVHGHINYPIYLTDWQRIENGQFTSLKSYAIEIQSKPAIPTSAIQYGGLVAVAY